MFISTTLIKKIVLAALVAAISLAALPSGSVSAAALEDPGAPPADPSQGAVRLDKIWAREQAIYQREDKWLTKADALITRVQTIIDKANEKGWNPTDLQSALDAFAAVIPAARAAHSPGAAMIASHAGFDAAGKVINRAAALQTVKALGKVLKDTRDAMSGTGKALHLAIKALRAAHPRPAEVPAP